MLCFVAAVCLSVCVFVCSFMFAPTHSICCLLSVLSIFMFIWQIAYMLMACCNALVYHIDWLLKTGYYRLL